MKAITSHDVIAVQHCLASGEDPNQVFPVIPDADSHLHQPTTPLRLVMFCISNSLLDDADIKQFAEITKLLIEYGADPKPAMEIAEARYGKYDPDAKGDFMEVWHMIAKAMK